ncbi:unnamed protein product, partial [marine sediment metagenome]
IDGWLSDSEGELLYKLAKEVPSGQAIVELGSWKGKSTVWLAKGTEAGQRNEVYSIDPHSGTKAHVSEGEMNTYTAFLTNLTKAGGQATVVPLVTTSEKCARRWREGVGLLWVDASARYVPSAIELTMEVSEVKTTGSKCQSTWTCRARSYVDNEIIV